MSSVNADYTFDDNTVFQINQNANITFPSATMTFDMVDYGGSYLILDATNISIDSTNSINISLSYLNSNILSINCGSELLRFNANTGSGTVWFNISGFKTNAFYDVYRDDSFFVSCQSDASGIISFSNSVWSDHEFSILESCQPTGYEYGNWSFSEHLKNDVLEEDWVESDDTAWYTEDNSAWWPGNSTYVFNASYSDFDVTVLNNSGMNRTQFMGWAKVNYTGEPASLMYPLIIFNYQNNNSFDAVLFSNHESYIVNWNGTNLTDISTGLSWSDFVGWDNQINPNWEYYYPGGEYGCYFKTIFDVYTGNVKFKYWNPNLMGEPAGWAVEYQNDDLIENDIACLGLGGWNPSEVEGRIHYDLFNVWQLNYTRNSSATITLDGETFDRPHMTFPVLNMTNYVSWEEYIESTAEGNVTIDTVRDVMRMLTNNMSLESRLFTPDSLESLDQNDNVYYYSCVYDELRNYTEETTGDDVPDWLYDEYLHLHVQMCTDGELDESGSGTFYDDMIVCIDVDNDGTWDSNDRVFWMGSDGLRVQYNGNTYVDPDFNASVWETDTSAIGNLHRYNTHVNYGFNLPLATLVKSDGDPLNVSDVFGLSIINFDDGSDVAAVWQNWNETSGLNIISEAVDTSVADYFLNSGEGSELSDFPITSTEINRWGEGVIFGGDALNESKELSYAMTVEVQWDDTIALTIEDEVQVNGDIWVNNTGTGDLTDIWVNQTWWNCSCSDLNMTFISSNLDSSNISWFNDSCYWVLHNESLTLEMGESWHIEYVVNITACPGVTTGSDTITTVGNASELSSDVTSDDSITFQWGVSPGLRIRYTSNQGNVLSGVFSALNLVMVLAIVLAAVVIFFVFNMFRKQGEQL